jgi:hypothetical protein
VQGSFLGLVSDIGGQQAKRMLVKVPAYVESHLLFSQLFKAYILPKVYTEQRSYKLHILM